MKQLPLSALRIGEEGIVCSHTLPPMLEERMRDIGLQYGTSVTCVGRSPLGDPAAYRVCGSVLALRDADSHYITVERAE